MKQTCMFLLSVIITQTVFADIECDVSITDYYALYDQSVGYTCLSGQYLPASAENCVACPAGYVCSGGTFSFNENNYQGAEIDSIGTTSMNNVCADNFPVDLFAIYEPIDIGLTWDDGNGNTVSTTCTYDGLITLPPEPTRPGYVFKGWKLQTNE